MVKRKSSLRALVLSAVSLGVLSLASNQVYAVDGLRPNNTFISTIAGSAAQGDIQSFDDPIQDVSLTWDVNSANRPDTAPISNTTIIAKSLTLNTDFDTPDDGSHKNMGIRADQGKSVDVKVTGDIAITTKRNSLYAPGGRLAIEGFKSLTVTNTNTDNMYGYGVFEHEVGGVAGGVVIKGGADSTVTFNTRGQALAANSEKGITLSADTVKLTSGSELGTVMTGSIDAPVGNIYIDGNKLVKIANTQATFRNLDGSTLAGGAAIAPESRGDIVINGTGRGTVEIDGHIVTSEGTVAVNMAGANSYLKGETVAGLNAAKVTRYFTETDSGREYNGRVFYRTVSSQIGLDGTINLNVAGENSSITGNISSVGQGVTNVNLTGTNTNLTGDITAGSYGGKRYEYTDKRVGYITRRILWTSVKVDLDRNTIKETLPSNGIVNANFSGDNAVFNGKVTTIYNRPTVELPEEAATNLSFGSKSRWNMTGDSNVTTLKQEAGSIIDMTKDTSKLMVDRHFEGNGVIRFNLDAGNKNQRHESGSSDYVYSYGTSAGVEHIAFDKGAANLGGLAKGDKLYFSTVTDSQLSYVSDTDLNEVAPRGTLYDTHYFIDKDTDNDGSHWYIGWKNQTENPIVPALGDTTYLSYALATDMDRLHKRLGESRYLDADSALWVRVKHDRTEKENLARLNTNIFQLGIDRYRNLETGRRYGVAVDFGRSNHELVGHSISGHSNSLGISAYYVKDRAKDKETGKVDNSYFDAIARFGNTIHKLDIYNGSDKDKASYNEKSVSVSVETGKKHMLSETSYFEPQVQLQYAHVFGTSYALSNGIQMTNNSINSLKGRLGFRLGKEFKQVDKSYEVYMKADLIREFLGRRGFNAVGIDGASAGHTYSGQETWGDIGVGADIKLANDTTLWVDVERIIGGKFKNSWEFNGGVTLKF